MKKKYVITLIALVTSIIIAVAFFWNINDNSRVVECKLESGIYHQEFDKIGNLWIDFGSTLVSLEKENTDYAIKERFKLTSYINELTFNDDNDPLAVSENVCNNGVIQKGLWLITFRSGNETEMTDLLDTNILKNDQYISYQLSPTGKYLAVQLRSGYISVITLDEFEEIYRVESNINSGFDSVYNPYYFIGNDRQFTYDVGVGIQIYDIENKSLLDSISFDYLNFGYLYDGYSLSSDLAQISLFGGTLKNNVKLLDSQTLKELATIQFTYMPSKVSFTPNGKSLIFIANDEGQSYIYKYEISRNELTVIGKGVEFAVSKDGSFIALSNINIQQDSSTLSILDLINGQVVFSINNNFIN